MRERWIEASWLDLRYRADDRARQRSLPLVRDLAEHLLVVARPRPADETSSKPVAQSPGLAVVDVGAGTGANLRWLGPRLDQALGSALTQEWDLLDHDAVLLEAVREDGAPWLRRSTRHTGSVATLAELLQTTEHPRVVSCSALLDLLTASQIDDLVVATVRWADAALWSLSVTGDVTFSPSHADDALLVQHFNKDQQRGAATATGRHSLAGPDGWRMAERAFIDQGWRVSLAHTPWILGTDDGPMIARLLTERAQAALKTTDGSADRQAIETWLALRLHQTERGQLEVRVDHQDLLALPVKSISEQTSSPSW
ncbi:MAG: hypothetical protein WBG89_05610 [Ornithinimicrobium sp.]